MSTPTRSLILDLLPDTPGARITAVTYFDQGKPAYAEGAHLGADGTWHVDADTTIDPDQIIEFTVRTGDTTTTYTEGADTNEWTAIITRRQA